MPEPTPIDVHEGLDLALDLQTFGVLCSIDRARQPGWLAALLQRYLHTSAVAVEQIHAAAAEYDLVEVAALAHSIKSSTRAIGAVHLGKVLEQIEHSAQARLDDAPLPELLAQLDRCAAAVHAAVRRALPTCSQPA